MKLYLALHVAAVVLYQHPQKSSSLAIFVPSSRFAFTARSLFMTPPSNDFSEADEPFFKVYQMPTATSSSKLDHIVECAEAGSCDVEEMIEMVEELEKLNLECAGEMSRGCNLDAVVARNVLKVALAVKIAADDTAECYFSNPYSEMLEMQDECVDPLRQMPTASVADKLERIVHCAQEGGCPVGEVTELINELERLNQECENTLSRECILPAVEARNILKVALGSQAAVAREAMSQKDP